MTKLRVLGLPVVAAMVALAVPLSAFACVFGFALERPDGTALKVVPGREVTLSAGSTYTLNVTFTADHRNCREPVDATVYLLGGGRWSPDTKGQPLEIVGLSGWRQVSSLSWTQSIEFKALDKGTFEIEIVRECPKGGYDDFLAFEVR